MTIPKKPDMEAQEEFWMGKIYKETRISEPQQP